MKQRIPNTTVYLDTADFNQLATPLDTDLQISDRIIVSKDRDGSVKDQTINGALTLNGALAVNSDVTVDRNSKLSVDHITSYDSLYCDCKVYVEKDILPNDSTVDLGANDSRNYFNNVYANNLHGILPHPYSSSNQIHFPTGCIFLAIISKNTNFSLSVSEEIILEGGLYLYVAKRASDGNWTFGYQIPYGRFVLLSSGDSMPYSTTLGTRYSLVALVMCTFAG